MTTTTYINAIERELQTGHATEHSYRPMLRQFLVEWSQDFSPATEHDVINDPQRIESNAPDFLVRRGEASLGWIEAKPPGTDLDVEETSEQLQRYRKAFPNLILTDYLEFRLYSAGENCLSVRVADLDRTTNRLINQNTDDSEISRFLTAFFGAEPPKIGKASDLARMLSGKAQLLKVEIADLFQNTSNNELQNQLDAFREHLIADLSEAKFADMMAQTITYSLFAARCYHTHGKFNRTRAIEILAETNPFLSQLFWVSIQRLTHLHWIIDPIAELLDLADMESITADFGTEGKEAGPIVHFYEDFLSDYDPKLRKQRGVYYTPEPVVSYIVRSVDAVLTEKFNLVNGLAHTGTVDVNGTQLPKVQILDPAAGTGTFLRSVISQIHHTIITSGMAGAWQEYVPRHLLPRIHGFERMVAPYAMCHLTLTYQLAELKYHLKADERLNVYLTDTLEARNRQREMPIFIGEIAKEAEAAATVKSDLPVMVIVKNPPYAGKSENKGKWIKNLLRGLDGDILTESYFEVDGKPLDETTQRWLGDDYVKFIRFAQWRISQTGYGVLAFISNHGYLKNHTFSGMRQSLMETFDAIYVLDLHGNKITNEDPPNGGPDENVFEIKQGVAIGIFVKHAPEKLNSTRVCHAELWGNRKDKYNWLAANTINTTPWKTLTPTSPNYRFAPKCKSEEYEHYRKITDIFPLNKTGLSTKRDKMVIDFESKPILERVNHFRNSTEPDEILCQQLPISMIAEWNISQARESLRNEQHIEKYIQPILHFPFDERFIFYHDDLVARPRKDVMRHLLAGENIAMCVGRAGEAVGDATWNLVSISNTITDLNVFRRGGTPVFPLYRYAEQGSHRFHNISQSFVEEVCQHLNYEIDSTDAMSFILDGKGDLHTTIGPEDIFHYIYAILHAPKYRDRYKDQLKIDFPHIPLTTNRALFQKLASLGEQLVTLHLLQNEDTNLPNFPESGNSEVEKEKVCWSEIDQRVQINATQYFAPIRREVWEFSVGGHHPAKKWLTDRKSRTLTFDDIEHYRRICGTLDKTVKIMEDIDNTIAEHGGWPLENKA